MAGPRRLREEEHSVESQRGNPFHCCTLIIVSRARGYLLPICVRANSDWHPLTRDQGMEEERERSLGGLEYHYDCHSKMRGRRGEFNSLHFSDCLLLHYLSAQNQTLSPVNDHLLESIKQQPWKQEVQLKLMIFSAPYLTGANVYFICTKLQENYWLGTDKIMSLNRHRCFSLSQGSLTLIKISISSVAQYPPADMKCSRLQHPLRWLRSIWWMHLENLSLTCPELILPGVKHGIGFKDEEVARVRRLSAGPGAPQTCHFHTRGTCWIPNRTKHHHRLSVILRKSHTTSSTPSPTLHRCGPGSLSTNSTLHQTWGAVGDPDPAFSQVRNNKTFPPE